MPEDQNTQIPEQEAPQAPPAPDPWQSWQQAGFAPDQNPHEVRQALDWVQAITDENRHELELERSLREWGHRPESDAPGLAAGHAADPPAGAGPVRAADRDAAPAGRPRAPDGPRSHPAQLHRRRPRLGGQGDEPPPHHGRGEPAAAAGHAG